MRRVVALVGAVALLAGLSACAAQSSEAPASKWGFAVQSVSPAWGDMPGAVASIYVPAFTEGAVVRVFSVEADALGREVCSLSVVADEVEVSGDCSRTSLNRGVNGHLDGLRVLLTGLEPGDHFFDVWMQPVVEHPTTGEWHYDLEAPSVERLGVHVPA